MAFYFSEPDNVSLKTPLVRFDKKNGETPALSMNIPMVSAVMQAVSDDKLAIALAKEGGISFIYGSQSIKDQAEMVSRVKSYKAGYVTSDSNVRPNTTLEEVLELSKKTGHSTCAVTEDGTSHGKLVGIITSKDFRIGHCTQRTNRIRLNFWTKNTAMSLARESTREIIWSAFLL